MHVPLFPIHIALLQSCSVIYGILDLQEYTVYGEFAQCAIYGGRIPGVFLRNLYQLCSAFVSVGVCIKRASTAMFETFELCRLVEKLPLKICAIATWGECAPVGSRAREVPANSRCALIGVCVSFVFQGTCSY